MTVNGLHLLVTYKCNARCRHCFLSAGPEHSRVISRERGLALIQEASELPEIDHLFLEGGEPFLFPDLLLDLVKAATTGGLWVGVLSNGFWAHSRAAALARLEPLAAAGLRSLSISTDSWHEEFVSREKAVRAATIAQELDISADIMSCNPLNITQSKGKVEAEIAMYTGDVVGRGRAVDSLKGGGEHHWEELVDCREKLSRPGRVHVGPDGEVHLCQGLLLGHRAGDVPLGDILAAYAPTEHPLVSRLIEGGPAAMARHALELDWEPSGLYLDSCHLCYEVRTFLRPLYPELIGPPEIYQVAG